jgi:hypothetical protein
MRASGYIYSVFFTVAIFIMKSGNDHESVYPFLKVFTRKQFTRIACTKHSNNIMIKRCLFMPLYIIDTMNRNKMFSSFTMICVSVTCQNQISTELKNQVHLSFLTGNLSSYKLNDHDESMVITYDKFVRRNFVF